MLSHCTAKKRPACGGGGKNLMIDAVTGEAHSHHTSNCRIKVVSKKDGA